MLVFYNLITHIYVHAKVDIPDKIAKYIQVPVHVYLLHAILELALRMMVATPVFVHLIMEGKIVK